MNRTNVRHDVISLLNRLHKEYPNKSPYLYTIISLSTAFPFFEVSLIYSNAAIAL